MTEQLELFENLADIAPVEPMATLPNKELNRLIKLEEFVEALIEVGRLEEFERDHFLREGELM